MPVRGDNSLYFATALDNSGLYAGRVEAENIIIDLAKRISKINPFAALAIGATAAFAVIANEATQLAKSYEAAMLEVKTIAGLTNSEFDRLSQDVINISKTLGTEPPNKLANGLYEIIGAGFDAAEALKILEVSSKAATAGVTTSAVASDGLTTILNSFQLAAEDATEVADIMFATVDRGKITFEELASNIATVAPLAASSNISFQEIGGAISSLTKQGVPAAVAITQIRSAIIAATEILGDGAFEVLTFQEALQKVADLSGGSQNNLKEMAGRIEAVNAILSLTGPNLKGAVEDLEAMDEAAGSVNRSFGTITSGNIQQWDILRNRIKATTLGIGNSVLEMSSGVAQSLNDMFTSFDGVSRSLKAQQVDFEILSYKILSSNTSIEERTQLLEEAQKIAPQYLKDLDAETSSYEELKIALDRANESLNQKILLQLKEEEIEPLRVQRGRQILEIKEMERALEEKLLKAAKDKGIELDNTKSILEQQIDIYRQIQDYEERTRAAFTGRAVALSSGDVGFDISQLQTAQQTLDFINGKIDNLVAQKNELTLTVTTDAGQVEETVSEALAKIAEATKRDQLSAYLKSDNEEIKKAAEERLQYLKDMFSPKGDDTYADFLDQKRKEYEDYEKVVKQLGAEATKGKYDELLKQGDDYAEFLRGELAKTKDFAKQRAIALAADSYGQLFENTKVEQLKIDTKGVIPPLEISIDKTSRNAVQAEVDKLYAKFDKAQTDSERRQVAARINEKEKELKAIDDLLNDQAGLYEDLYRDISNMSIKQIAEDLRVKKKALKELLKDEEKNAAAIDKVRGEIRDGSEEIAARLEATGAKLASVFNSLSQLFGKFGDEEMSQLLDQLAGVAQGAAKLGAGIATGDVFSIIQGSLDILNSAITVEIVSDTAKFEEAIDKLEKAISDLDYAISQSIGDERIANRAEAIKQLEELEKQAALAQEAERKARKEVKFLGLTVGNKGEGSGTDPKKLEELEQQAEDARRRVEELNKEIDELFTGTTSQNIADGILAGLEEGKRGAEEFATNFEQLMKDAVLESLKRQFLEQVTNTFFKDFADLVESGGGLTQNEIDQLRDQYNSIVENAGNQLDALNQILESAGIDTQAVAPQDRQGLQGDISTITEDTANVLAGTLNAIRIDVANGLSAALEANVYLALINANGLRMIEALEYSNARLLRIENSLA